MTVPVTPTKIIVPRPRPDLLSRPRLLDLLDDILDYPITLISAPAGYGKTSLLIDLAQKAEYPIAWLSIDNLDRDFKRFISHLIASLTSAFPVFGIRTKSLIDNSDLTQSEMDQLLRVLLNDIYLNISEHFVMILEDFHQVADVQIINEFINRFCQEMDDNCHLVMTSRSLFNLPDLPLLVGRKEVLGVGLEELAFQANEIKSLLKNKYQLTITDQESKSLIEEAEGWITGLLLSFETGSMQIPDQSRASKVSGVNLFNYLAQQVLERQSQEIQDFLLRSSFLDEFNSEVCSQVFGKSQSSLNWTELISKILQSNLFVQPLEADNTWLRYHQLFQSFLQTYYLTNYPEQAKNLLSRILEFYSGEEDWEKAYAVSQIMDDPAVRAKLIDQASSDLFHSGRVILLSEWLDGLPESGFEACPRLYAVQGISKSLLGNPPEGLNLLQKALFQPSVLNDPNILGRCLICRATTYRLLGRYEDALLDAQAVLSLSQDSILNTILFAEANREVGLGYFYLGDLGKSEQFLNASLDSYNEHIDYKNIAHVYMDLGVLCMNKGRFKDAYSYYNNAQLLWENLGNESQQAGLLNNLGVITQNQGDYLAAMNWFKAAQNKAQNTSNIRMEAFIYASLGDLAMDLNLFPIAKGMYQQARSFAQVSHDGYLISYLELCLATYYRKTGDYKLASNQLDKAYDYILQNTPQGEIGLWYLERGQLDQTLGNFSSAEDYLNNAKNIFKESGKPIDLAKAYFAIGINLIQSDKLELGINSLKTASMTLLPLGTLNPILPDLHFHKDLIIPHLESSSSKTINDLNFALGQFEDLLPTIQNSLFPSTPKTRKKDEILEIKALGHASVLRHSKKISNPEWTQQRTARELFFFLVSKPRGASKEQIGLIFWPESSKSQLSCQFKNAIYRLRKAIGTDSIIYDQSTRNYKFNKSIEYSYDVEEFLALINQAKSEENIESKVKYYKEAILKYKHPYGNNIDGIWAEPIRKNLSNAFEHAALIVSEYDLENGNPQESIKTCQILLEIEPTQEQCWRLMMLAYSARGDRSGIIRTYRECRNILKNQLGLNPSEITEGLYSSLIQ